MSKILIIGENCTDVFTYGDVERLSPEAPVPVFKPKKDVKNLGMAGNVYKNVKSLTQNFEITFWTQKEEIVKQRLVDEKTNHMLLRVDTGENNLIKPLDLTEDKLLSVSDFDVVIISDYNKGFITEEIFLKIGTQSKLLFVDSKRKLSEKIVKVCDFIKLNLNESHNNVDLISKFPEKFIITLSAQGAKYLNQIFPSPKPQETIDVSGAGDTFISSLVIKYLETNNITESINFANKMSSLVVSKRGVVTPSQL